MRILYGVCGVGFGHSSRAGKVIPFLEKEGHKVLVVTYGQAYEVLKNFNVLEVKGISLSFDKGALSLKKTLAGSLKELGENKWNEIRKKIEEFKPDVCISDMEPIVPIVSFFYKLPLISLDNQHRLTHLKLKVPKKYLKDFYFARETVRSCISRADDYIILSFVKQKSNKKNVFVVGPILRDEILKTKPREKDFVLVYLSKSYGKILKILEKIDENFVVYGYDREGEKGNLKFRKAGKNFIYDLADAKAVIATSGFSLISESIFLKKPYFAMPLKGQFEQVLNALQLREMGLGDYSENPTKKEIESFLVNLEKYRKELKKVKTNPNEVFSVLRKVMRKMKSLK